MNAPKDQMFKGLATQLIKPQVITSGGGAKSGVINLQGITGGGCQGALINLHVGTAGDTLSGSVKLTATLLEGEASDGSDAVAVSDANAVMAAACAGKDAEGNAFASGVIAVIDAGTKDEADYAIQYHGNKPVLKVTITPSSGNTNGTPVCVTVTPLNPRKQGAASGF